MPANNYGIIVEGGYDSALYEAFIRKLAPHNVQVFPRLCEGKPNLLRKFPGFLEGFRHQQGDPAPIDMVIVLVDADGQDPLALEARMRTNVADRQYPFAVHFHAVQNAAEAWLLADVQAVSTVVQRRSGRKVMRTNDAPQDLLNPKPVFRRLLAENHIDYAPPIGAEIAAEIDPEIVSLRCPRFRVFAELVDC